MKPLTIKQTLVAECIIAGMFADFSNPEFRGPNFTWANFPAIVTSHVSSTFFVYFRTPPKYDPAALEQYCTSRATDLATRAGFVNT